MGNFDKSVRIAIFRRYNATCGRCGRTWNGGYMLECHHIHPSALGGENVEENGELLCRECHLLIHTQLFEQAVTIKEKNVNAYAVRMLKDRIKKDGIMRSVMKKP